LKLDKFIAGNQSKLLIAHRCIGQAGHVTVNETVYTIKAAKYNMNKKYSGCGEEHRPSPAIGVSCSLRIPSFLYRVLKSPQPNTCIIPRNILFFFVADIPSCLLN